jgi:antitoxin component of RelBE/YafQ-DinJ toxin-antitoxin module
LYTKCILVFTMVQTTVITTRIKKEVKEVLERAGINIPAVIKTYLEELAWKLQLSVETEEMRKLLENVKPSEKGFAEKSVREDRESH